MTSALTNAYGDVLRVLEPQRQLHSLAVGQKAEALAWRVPVALRADLVAAAVLHDIGYGHPITGLHALDGARFLANAHFSMRVCNLVAHHSASMWEARERNIDSAEYAAFAVPNLDLGPAHAVLWWADMTTGPDGRNVTVEDRLAEICARYGPDDVVTRFITRARPVLLAAGQSPVGSIQVPS